MSIFPVYTRAFRPVENTVAHHSMGHTHSAQKGIIVRLSCILNGCIIYGINSNISRL